MWEKNTDLTDPDLIEPGKTLKVPTADEALTDRPLPTRINNESLSTRMSYGDAPRSTLVRPGGVFGSDNPYSYGYCTAWAWSQRPDLPNNLGNANSWAVRAAAQGFTVSDSPTVGSVGVAKNYMHVVIITGIHDGMVDISEQNYVGWGIVSTRTTAISEFTYIL